MVKHQAEAHQNTNISEELKTTLTHFSCTARSGGATDPSAEETPFLAGQCPEHELLCSLTDPSSGTAEPNEVLQDHRDTFAAGAV